MFGLGIGELVLVLVLAVVLIGPKDLPRFASQLGRLYRQLKAALDELKHTVEHEISVSDDTTTPPKKTPTSHE